MCGKICVQGNAQLTNTVLWIIMNRMIMDVFTPVDASAAFFIEIVKSSDALKGGQPDTEVCADDHQRGSKDPGRQVDLL